MANDYVHLSVIFVHMVMKDTIFMNVVYMYIHFQRTENERSTHNQVNIPTIAVGAHEQKAEGPFLFHWILIVGMIISNLIILIIYNAH